MTFSTQRFITWRCAIAIDRGELRYSIRVRDEFRGTLRRFRRQIEDARRAIEGLANTRLTGRQARQATTQQAQQIQAVRQGIQAQQAATQKQTQLLQQQSSVRQQQIQAIRNAARAQIRQGLIESRQSSNRIQGLNQTNAAARRAAAGVRRIGQETRAVNRDGGRLLFTFRRLFGALAAFTLAREAAGAFRDLVGLGISFNAELQLGRLGFAGLLTAAGEVRNAQGQLLQGQEAFNASLAEAGRLQGQLRQRALETTATAQELSFAFQQAIAPGLARGLDPDQILDLTVGISQAASAIGLAQNQLAEETRSILQGTARAQTTRLAALFGGATELNKLVRQARDADELFQILTDRLSGTSEAARQAARTVPGLFARIRDALGLVTGTAARDFFEDIGDVLQEIFDSLVVINEETGRLEPNPAVLGAFVAIFDALSSVVDRARQFASEIGFEGLVTGARAFAAVLQIIGNFLLGVGRGVAFIGTLAASLARPFIEIAGSAGALVAFLSDVAEVLGSMITSLALIRTSLFLAASAAGLFKISMEGTAAASALTSRSLLAIGAALTLGVELARRLVNFFAGANLSLRQTAQILSEGVLATLESSIAAARQFFKELGAEIRASGTTELVGAATALLERRLIEIRRLFDAGELSRDEANVQAEKINEQLNQLAGILGNSVNELDGVRAERDKVFAALDEFLADDGRLNEILSDAGTGETEQITERVRELLGTLRGELDAFEQENENRFTGRGADEAVTPQQERQLSTARQQLALERQRALNQRSIVALAQQGATQGEISLQQERNKLALLVVQRQNRIQEVSQQVRALEVEREQATSEAVRINIQDRINALKARGTAETQAATAEIALQNAQLQEQRLVLEGTIGDGLSRGLRNFAERFGSSFEAGIRIAEGVLNRFSSFVSQTIVDAFDPTKDFDIRERFARFLQDIAQLVLQQFVQLALARAILGLSGGPAPSLGGASTRLFTGAEGGQVPGGPSYESRPPPGAPRSDTVLARLTPGEHVDPVRTVSRLGADFFDRLRTGAGDPMALRALVGLGTGRKARRAANRSGFFQSGGIVSQARQTASATQSSSPAASGVRDGNGIQRAIVVSNENEMEKLIAGGAPALLQFMRDNSDEIGIGQAGGGT